jgi:hypothetical protein
MLWQTILDVAAALLAVFGFYCALRMVADLFWNPKQICIAVRVQNKEDAEMLDVLLHEAYSAFFRKGRRIAVLLSSELMNGMLGEGEELFEKYNDLMDAYGAECYLIDL